MVTSSLIIPFAAHKLCRWRNGQGETREIAIGSSPDISSDVSDSFLWRISSATVSTSGPFSDFEGYERTIMVLSGGEMVLTLPPSTTIPITYPNVPVSFDGGRPCKCAITEPVVDFNVFTKMGEVSHTVDILDVYPDDRPGAKPASLDLSANHDIVFFYVLEGSLNPNLNAGDCLRVDSPSRTWVMQLPPDFAGAIVAQISFSFALSKKQAVGEAVGDVVRVAVGEAVGADAGEAVGANVGGLSKKQAKRAVRKNQKKLQLDANVASQVALHSSIHTSTIPSLPVPPKTLQGGKAFRARQARAGRDVTISTADHRAAGGAPLAEHDDPVTAAIEAVETRQRVKFRPHLVDRAEILTDNHGSMIEPPSEHGASVPPTINPLALSLSESSLRFLVLPPLLSPALTSLDLSRNELWTLPSLKDLPALTHLDISRNWFKDLPDTLAELPSLTTLLASHNMLQPGKSLQLPILSFLNLTTLDLRFNQLCGHASLVPIIHSAVPSLTSLLTTVTFPRPEGAYAGEHPADRDPALLRSQLEPWSTSALRRRMVADFGEPALPDEVGRGRVMATLLKLYEEEDARTVLHARGTPVSEDILARVKEALVEWSNEFENGNLERESIKAENYMILTSPIVFKAGSKKAQKTAGKLAKYEKLWRVAMEAVNSVDAQFGACVTAVAVTHNFSGSPHIDRQNVGPFYGLSVGPTKEGTGGIMVEASARVVCHVDTLGRMGMVDGRYPHWVGAYEGDRWSLIFYRTLGEACGVGPAVFDEKLSEVQGDIA